MADSKVISFYCCYDNKLLTVGRGQHELPLKPRASMCVCVCAKGWMFVCVHLSTFQCVSVCVSLSWALLKLNTPA